MEILSVDKVQATCTDTCQIPAWLEGNVFFAVLLWPKFLLLKMSHIFFDLHPPDFSARNDVLFCHHADHILGYGYLIAEGFFHDFARGRAGQNKVSESIERRLLHLECERTWTGEEYTFQEEPKEWGTRLWEAEMEVRNRHNLSGLKM